MTKKELIAELARLQAVAAAAVAACRANKTPENMDATRATSAAVSAFMGANNLSPKVRGRPCRAGLAQHKEERAETLRRMALAGQKLPSSSMIEP